MRIVDIDVPVQEVWSSFRYDPDNGTFFWRDGARVRAVILNEYECVWWKDRYFALHRIAWVLMTGEWPADIIDHRNRDKKDNSWVNLRAANWSQNAQNKKTHSNNKLGIKGIRLNGERFEPRLMKDGKAIYLGLFKTLAEAVEARKAAEEEHFTHAR
jgi:hypothetical protein